MCTPNKHNKPPTPPTRTLDTPRHAAAIQEHSTLPESHAAKYMKPLLLVGVVVVVLLLLNEVMLMLFVANSALVLPRP